MIRTNVEKKTTFKYMDQKYFKNIFYDIKIAIIPINL